MGASAGSAKNYVTAVTVANGGGSDYKASLSRGFAGHGGAVASAPNMVRHVDAEDEEASAGRQASSSSKQRPSATRNGSAGLVRNASGPLTAIDSGSLMDVAEAYRSLRPRRSADGAVDASRGGLDAGSAGLGGVYEELGRHAPLPATSSRGCRTPPLGSRNSTSRGAELEFDVEKRFQQDMSAASSQRAPPSSAAVLRQSPGLAAAPLTSHKGGGGAAAHYIAVASRSWTAKGADQMTVQKGTSVDVLVVLGQWAWCRADIAQGWVPMMYLSQEAEWTSGREDLTPTVDKGGAAATAAASAGQGSARAVATSGVVSAQQAAGTADVAPSSGRKRRSPRKRKNHSGASPAVGDTPTDGVNKGGDTGGDRDGAGARVVEDAPAPPEKWMARLKDTMVLHTVSNAMRLAHYLLQQLTGGYGTISALHIACWEGSVGAVSAVVNGSKTLVKEWHSRPRELTPLHIAALCGHVGVVESLLQLDADPNVPTVHNIRALHIAASSNYEISEVLLASRADVSVVTADADTPLHYACCYHQVATIELLLKAAAAAAVSPNPSMSVNNFGVVPLHLAAAHSAFEGVAISKARDVLLLCSYRADPTVSDHHGMTPANVSRMARGDASITDFLQAAAGEKHRIACELLSNADAAEASAAADRDDDGGAKEDERTGLSSTCTAGPSSPQCPASAGRLVNSRTSDLRLAEENSSLAAEVARLGKELEQARSSHQLMTEMFEHSKRTVEQMRNFSTESQSQAWNGEDMTQLRQEREEFEKERAELNERQQAMEDERRRLHAEGDEAREQQEEELQRLRVEVPRLRRQVEEEAARRAAAEAAAQRAAGVAASKEAAASAATEAAAAAVAAHEERLRRPPSRPSSALRQKDVELNEKDALLNDRGAELAGVHAELARALAEVERKREELSALRDSLEQGRAAAVALTEELAAAGRESERQAAEGGQAQARLKAERDSARAQNQRLEEQLKKQTADREEAWVALSELRKQQSELREEHARLRLASTDAEAASKAREAALSADSREKELLAQKMQKDVAEISAKLRELEGCRERAERADRMLQPLESRIQELHTAFAEEQALRKRYHNQMQDLKGAIRVFARVRPVAQREQGEEIAVRKLDAFQIELAQGNDRQGKPRDSKQFTFDSIFDEHATQEDVFAECRGLASSAIDGFNVTVFAYGQTGAGKTHTMYGSQQAPGLVPRIARELFSLLGRYAHECQAQLRCSMFELYRDDLLDLLLPKVKGKAPVPLDVKKDSRGSVFVDRGTEREVASCEELLQTINEGIDRRHVCATKMNSESSRSHLICIVVVESTSRKTKQVATGKLTLCDLAGSERIKKSEVTGDAMKEAQSINKSLTALGDVIEALTKSSKHIPYRNHKLTQLLSDSIGGNAKTLMFVNCSPVASNVEESLSSLSYAARAKLIMNKVEKNQDSQEVARLKKVVQVMSQELEQARASCGGAAIELPPQSVPSDAPPASGSAAAPK